MKHFSDDDYTFNFSTSTAVCTERESDPSADERAEKPLWLTAREAESLLVLCAASPVSAGPCELVLFTKLSRYFRSHLS